MIFYHWYGSMSRGKLHKHSTVRTLEWKVGRFACMHANCHDYNIPQEIIDEVKNYIRIDLSDELGLKDIAYPKEIADWTDVKIMIHHLWFLDLHEYRNNRFRVQLSFLYLLFSATGERLGAVVRSECYREENQALCYEDIELFMKPSPGSDSAPIFTMYITFKNRKGERLDDEEYLKLTFEQEDNDVLAHCIIQMFLVLAFLDAVFEDVTTPRELYGKRNPCDGYLPIRFRSTMKHIPILRRSEGTHSRNLSSTLPWSSTSVTQEAQRIASECGFPQRFTFYNIRRGLSNKVDGEISTAHKIQLMGHQDPKDRIFRRWYQSRHFTAPVEDIFKDREPRSKDEALSMYIKQDHSAPLKLPEDMRETIFAADDAIQELLRSRRSIKSDMDEAVKSNNQLQIRTLVSAAARIRRHLAREEHRVTQSALKKYRADWFEKRPGEVIRSQEHHPATQPPHEYFQLDRLAVLESLYSKDTSRLLALERLLDYCVNNFGNSKVHQRSQPLHNQVLDVRENGNLRKREMQPTKKRPYTHMSTSGEVDIVKTRKNGTAGKRKNSPRGRSALDKNGNHNLGATPLERKFLLH